jgi:hypothetical protein
MTTLREAIEDMCTKADRREAMRRQIGDRPVPARVGVDVLRSLLTEHPDVKPSDEPWLGLATTQQLIQELAARADVASTIGESWPQYRPIDS